MLSGWLAVFSSGMKSSLGQHENASAADSNMNSSTHTISMLPTPTPLQLPTVAVAALPSSLARFLAMSSLAHWLATGYTTRPGNT